MNTTKNNVLAKAIEHAAFVKPSAVDHLINNASTGEPLQGPLFHILVADRQHTPATAYDILAIVLRHDCGHGSEEFRKGLVEFATAAKAHAEHLKTLFAVA